MIKKNCLKEFIVYTSLNVLSMIGLSCYILADTFFVAKRLGSDGLTALNIAIPVFNVIHGSGLMLGVGGAIRFNVRRSQGKNEEGDTAFTHSVVMALVLTAVYYIASIFFVAPISHWLGADADTAMMTQNYIRVLLFFSPAFMINNILQSYVRNDGNPQLAMAAMVSGSLSNILFDYIFMFIFNMDILGAAVATGFSPVVSMAVISPYIVKRKNNFRLIRCRFSPKLTNSILSGGLPSLVTEISSGAVIFVFNALILEMEGNIGVAAYGVIANLSLVVISIYTGIAQGIQPLASKYYAVGNNNLRSILRYAVSAVSVLSVLIYIFVFFKADLIAALFNSEGKAQLGDIAVYGLRLYFLGCPFAGFNIVISSFFISADKPKPANAVSFLRGLVLIIPMSILLSVVGEITGLWLSFAITEAIVSAIGLFLLRHKKKETASHQFLIRVHKAK